MSILRLGHGEYIFKLAWFTSSNYNISKFALFQEIFFRNKVQIPNLEKLEDIYFFQKIRNETKKACDLKIELFTDC